MQLNELVDGLAREGITVTQSQSPALLDAALRYARHGLKIHPLKRDNTPYTPHGFQDASIDPDLIMRWWRSWPGANIGFYCRGSGFVVLDVDPRNNGNESLVQLCEEHDWLPNTTVASTPSGGAHYYFKAGSGPYKGSLGPGLDVKFNGYTVLPPSWRDDGVYTWVSRRVLEVAPTWMEAPAPVARKPRPVTDEQTQSVLEALAYISPDDYKVWADVGMAMHHGLGEAGLDYWAIWSSGSDKHKAGDCAKKWPSFHEDNGITLGTLFHYAQIGGYR